MPDATDRTIFLCSCERSMRPDAGLVADACRNAEVRVADHLCRAEIGRYEAALGEGRPVLVACRQEEPVFREAAEEAGFAGSLAFADIRAAAGWSREPSAAGPKTAALLAAAEERMPAAPLVSFESRGVALVYGRDGAALELARRLADRLDLTVLLNRPGDVTPPRLGDIPVYRGTVVAAKGHLGAFELTVDDFAAPAPSSRDRLAFGPGKNGAKSNADIVIDITGGAPLFPSPDLRAGYLRADPADPAALARLQFDATGLTGTFDKPRYVAFEATLCAHSRSKKIGCTRCLDLCPTGAITPAGDHVAIDPHVCAGCGACAAVCPTGAASSTLPPADALMRKLRRLLLAYRAAGGRNPVVLFHDEAHGEPLIDALARFGDGLPANVLPLAVNEATQIGVETVAAALAFGAEAVRFLARAKPKHDIEALRRSVELARLLGEPLGYGADAASIVETDDPDALLAALKAAHIAAPPARAAPRRAADFLPLGDKRSVMRQALKALHEAAPTPIDVVALPDTSPFGRVNIDVAGCTLCLACVSACPANALLDNPERPQLRFSEEACVQCGLCAATCPEKVIVLEPRLDFTAFGREPVVVKEEEPFHCIRCAKPFGVKSTVERITEQLGARHWMFQGEGATRLDLVRMCEDCRVIVVTDQGLDPYAGPARPKPRTAEDYRRQGDTEGER